MINNATALEDTAQRWTLDRVADNPCIVSVDDRGAFCGLQLPDGTYVTGVRRIEVGIGVDDVQFARVELFCIVKART